MYQEVQEEKERVAQQASRQRTELDKLQRQLEDSHALALAAMKSEFEKAREEQENRHKVEKLIGESYLIDERVLNNHEISKTVG